MLLKKIFLENFRNHHNSSYELGEKITIFLGENGQGKTNILEAIFCLSTTKAFRTNKKEVFITYQKDFGRVKGNIKYTDKEEELEIFWSLHPNKNIYKKSDIACSVSDFIREKKFLAVLFSPEDMNLPVLSPSYRRKFLSRILAPLFPSYFDAALKYDAVLKNRNELLKKYAADENKTVQKDEFFFWDQELVKYHKIIQGYRKKFFDAVNIEIANLYEKISGKNDSLEIKFLPSVTSDFAEVLRKNFERDVYMRRTNAGSHRDDFQLLLREIPLQEGASRGETRSVLLALKMAEKNFVEKISGRRPLLLLDDVFSELDIHHQSHLLEYIKDYQSIITTTHSEVTLDCFGAKIYRL